MNAAAPATSARSMPWQKPLDLVALVKPRITLLVIITTLGGFFLAPGHPSLGAALWVLLGTVLVVGGANTLNMYLERDSDGMMRRTRNRPLPAGRLSPRTALVFGLGLGAASLPVLAFGANLLTAALGAFALFAYVLVYTPLKRRSPTALLVGSVPGAIPPLMGWTAATGHLELPGALLFGVLFVWQVPHFLAIAIYSSDDFARAGIRVLPLARGMAAAKRQMILFAAALLPVSLALVPLGVAGTAYFVTALVGGVVFFGWCLFGLRRDAGTAWARSLFLVSLMYLSSLFVVLATDHLLGTVAHG